MEVFILTLILVIFCFLAIGIRIWIKGSFTETEIGRNENMRKLGITCVKDEEMKLHAGTTDGSVVSGCGACAFMTSCSNGEQTEMK